MKVTEIERNFLGPKTGLSRVLRGTKCPKKSPDVCHKAQKSVKTSSNVPYCKAGHIPDGALKFGRAPKISLEHVQPTKMARTDHFRKTMCAGLSQPEIPALVVSY